MRNLLFLLCLLAALFVHGSSPDSLGTSGVRDSARIGKIYHVNPYVCGSIIAIGLVSDYYAIPRIIGKPPLTDAELHALNRGIINQLDREALIQNPSDRLHYKQLSDIIQVPIYLMPCLLSLNKNIRKDWFDLIFMYAQGHTLTFSFYNYSPLGPTFQNRYRPMTYYSAFTDEARQSGNNRNSFYSGHVASCSYSSFFMAKVYCDYHPKLGAKKYLVYSAALIPPVLMGYLRVKSLDHFPSDCVVGLALGAAIGIIIPQLHKNSGHETISVGLYTPPGAMGLCINWKFAAKRI